MIWKLTNSKGEPVFWYSKEELENLENKLKRIECVCRDIYTKTDECKRLKCVILEILEREGEKCEIQ